MRDRIDPSPAPGEIAPFASVTETPGFPSPPSSDLAALPAALLGGLTILLNVLAALALGFFCLLFSGFGWEAGAARDIILAAAPLLSMFVGAFGGWAARIAFLLNLISACVMVYIFFTMGSDFTSLCLVLLFLGANVGNMRLAVAWSRGVIRT